jgi:hypothetical protein
MLPSSCLQTHNKLFYSRHPKRNIASTRAREHVYMDGECKLAIMIDHRYVTLSTKLATLHHMLRTFRELAKLRNHRRRERLAIQRVK